jgi:hypothetical protein
MINIDNLTLGNEWKNDSNEVFKVTSNFSDGKKLYVELELIEKVEEENQPIPKK